MVGIGEVLERDGHADPHVSADRVAVFLKIQDTLAGFVERVWPISIGVTLRRADNR